MEYVILHPVPSLINTFPFCRSLLLSTRYLFLVIFPSHISTLLHGLWDHLSLIWVYIFRCLNMCAKVIYTKRINKIELVLGVTWGRGSCTITPWIDVSSFKLETTQRISSLVQSAQSYSRLDIWCTLKISVMYIQTISDVHSSHLWSTFKKDLLYLSICLWETTVKMYKVWQEKKRKIQTQVVTKKKVSVTLFLIIILVMLLFKIETKYNAIPLLWQPIGVEFNTKNIH